MERMIMVNKYDEEICELEWSGRNDFYKVKDEDIDMGMFRYLEDGDEFRVKKVWSEY